MHRTKINHLITIIICRFEHSAQQVLTAFENDGKDSSLYKSTSIISRQTWSREHSTSMNMSTVVMDEYNHEYWLRVLCRERVIMLHYFHGHYNTNRESSDR